MTHRIYKILKLVQSHEDLVLIFSESKILIDKGLQILFHFDWDNHADCEDVNSPILTFS